MTSATTWRGFEVLVVSPTPTHPQDHGNRKRIFEICRALQRRGAKVHFVHYPAEHDWRYDRPSRLEAAMAEQWDSYQLVAPTRPLHSPALKWTHEIDEWADPSITGYLGWACLKRRYDVAIVNYTWASFALEAIPAATYKVLDTHDVFGERRQLLESMGIEPEFFYTTRDEEARGVKRADLVWAIKDPEREYFVRDLGVADCLTMLHAEPPRDWWSGPPSNDGWLRAGVIGARNNINRRNLEQFLDIALPIFTKYMAPVKIVVAGGCSEDFERWRHPNLEVVGRVPEVDDFYRLVDVVIAPMVTSTGLKIKVAEALASGAPVIAHAHAMEGYPTSEPLHQMPSFEAMGRELVKLSFDRAPLAKLAAKSRAACANIQAAADAAIEATRTRVVAKISEKICVIAPLQALDPKSMLYDHFHSAVDYIRFTSGVEVFFVVGEAAKPNQDLLRSYDLQHHVFVDPELWFDLGALAPETWTPIRLSELLRSRGYKRAYVMADCREEILLGTGALAQAFVRHDLVEIGGGDADALVERLRKTTEVVVIGAVPDRIQRWEGESGVSEIVRAAVRRSGPFSRLATAQGEAADVLVLAPAGAVMATELANMCRRLGASVRTLDPADPATARAIIRGPEGADPLAGLSQTKLVVDLSPQTSLSIALAEAVMRQGVPCIVLPRGAEALALWRFPNALRPASVGRLLRTVADALTNDAKLASLRKAAETEIHARTANDAGWTVLWRLFTTKRTGAGAQDAQTDAAVALFG